MLHTQDIIAIVVMMLMRVAEVATLVLEPRRLQQHYSSLAHRQQHQLTQHVDKS
jgi:hypothetical protein